MACLILHQNNVLLWFVLLCFVMCVITVFGQQCPQYCSCSKTDKALLKASCMFQNIQQFQELSQPKDMVNLTISFTDHVDINEESFKDLDYTNLEALKLENCNIGTLSEKSFSQFVNLITLELHGNNIDTIDTNGFYGLINLATLKLTFNTIAAINNKAFNGLRLSILQLNDNSIPILTAQIFSGLQVTDIIFKANKLPKLTSATLEPIRNTVTRFTVSDNGVTLNVDEDTFQNTNLQLLKITHHSVTQHNFLKHVNTETLDISNNKLFSTDFNTYPSLISVQKADLSNIGIEYLSEDKFTSFSGLTELNLSHNDIFILDGDAFKVIPILSKLSVSYNPIIRISRNFGDFLTNLRELSLRGCQLAELIDPGPFLPMTSLQVLDLRDNLIQIVDMKMESFLDQLSQNGLKFHGNKFHCNCENIWFKQWVTREDLPGVTCMSPVAKIDIRSINEDDMICKQPRIPSVKGSTDYGAAVEGNGAILEVPVNVSIMLQCTSQGDPAPTLQWYFPPEIHDEVMVEPNINRTDLMTTSYYKLKEIRLEQSGQYGCSAYNLVSQTEAYIEVIVNENMTIPTASPYAPAAKATSNMIAILILVSIVVLLIIILILAVIYKIVNKEYNYHVAEAERLNELTAVNGAQNGKPEAELLNVISEKSDHTQTEL